MKQSSQRVTKTAILRKVAPASPRGEGWDPGDFTRGYIAAVAEFARRQTTPAAVLSAAGITREVAKAARPLRFDMDAIEEHLASSKTKRAKTRAAEMRRARTWSR